GSLDLAILHSTGGSTLIDEDSHRVNLLGGLPSAEWRAAARSRDRGGRARRGGRGGAEQTRQLFGQRAAVQGLFPADAALLHQLGERLVHGLHAELLPRLHGGIDLMDLLL